MIFNIRGKLVELVSPTVMGVINLTPDSFYAASRAVEPAEVVRRAGEMIRAGAGILDIGACSTRPGSISVSPREELSRLTPVMDLLRSEFPDMLISIDTFNASVVREAAVRWNVDIINDVSGGDDPDMFDVVAEHGLVYVLMHKRGTPADMQERCSYDDVTAEVISSLAFSLCRLRLKGVKDVIIDPGFGFAKNLEQNYRMIVELEEFKKIGPPVLVGISRKSMITSLLGCSSEEALAGTVALNSIAMMKGADIIRVHDVRPAVDAAQIVRSLKNVEKCLT